MPKVKFVHIGPGRSGTTFVYSILKLHKEICFPSAKELNFFNHNYSRGFAWYEKWFSSCSDKGITGEISNLYIYDLEVAQKIYDYNPKIKIICVLRNPYDYLVSVYKYRLKAGEIPHGTSFQKAISIQKELFDRSNYAKMIVPFLDKFSKEQIFLRQFEDLAKSPENYFNELTDFLDITRFGKINTEKVNPSQELRLPFLGQVTRIVSSTLRKMGLLKILQGLKDSKLLSALFYRKIDKSKKVDFYFTVDQVNKINSNIENLESLIGWDLKKWKRTLQ